MNKLDDKVPVCELCPFPGGAFMQADTSKWVHTLCSNWIPEVSTKKGRMQTLVHLDKKRYKLKCALCQGKKGACIQCSYGRCAVAAHPWCVLNKPQGFEKRIYKDDDVGSVFEIFCKNHASAVSDPIKPRPKSKNQPIAAPEEEEYVEPSKASGRGRKSEGGGRNSLARDDVIIARRLSMSHALVTSAAAKSDTTLSKPKPLSKLYDYDDDDDDADVGTQSKPIAGKGKGKGKSLASRNASSGSGISLSPRGGDPSRAFPLLTMSEWPGQAEGEVMDLDHFWNVVSTMYPEDQPPEVNHALTSVSSPQYLPVGNLSLSRR